MDIPIFFAPAFANESVFTLSEDTSRHVVQVLRMKPGAEVQLTNGSGSLITGYIFDNHKKHCTVNITSVQQMQYKSRKVSIAVSLLKNTTRFEWLLEKATEIGIAEIIPMICHRTEKQQIRYDRLHHIIVSAMIQSKQYWLPVIHHPTPFNKVIESSSYESKLIAHCTDGLKTGIDNFKSLPSNQILIGPEGDFTTHEIQAALSAGYQPVSLGNTRLRTETAGIVAATLLCT